MESFGQCLLPERIREIVDRIGEGYTDEEVAHLVGCRTCRDRIADEGSRRPFAEHILPAVFWWIAINNAETSDDVTRHLSTCSVCRERLAEVRRAVESGPPQ